MNVVRRLGCVLLSDSQLTLTNAEHSITQHLSMTTATTPKRFTFEPILYTTTNANNNTTTNSPSNNTTNTINNTNNINNTTTTTTTSMDIQIESGFGGGVLGRSKPRTRPSASQLEELKALYAQNRHPSRSAREQLGGRIGM